MPIIIESGITIEGGVSIGGGGAGFTVNSVDITYNRELYGGYSSASSSGFTCDGTNDTWNGIIYNTTQGLHDDIVAAWTSNGFDTGTSYVWHINWFTGGSILARVAVNPDNISNTIAIVPIDQSNTSWQSGSLGGPTLAGTFEFPAVFTPYVPTTAMSSASNWC